MSASLVGSEMCIRDRVLTPTRPGGHGDRAVLEALLRCGDDEQRAQRGWAVSYTHLTLPTICSV
eukprot:1033296-Alexandrium_andersonii.AAC.1